MPAARTETQRDKDREAKTRSRAGCLTCRSRHKKCDETRLDEHRGACRRCYVGAWHCAWPTPPGEKPLKTFVRGVKSGAAANGVDPAAGAAAPKQKKERFVPRRLSDAGPEMRSDGEDDMAIEGGESVHAQTSLMVGSTGIDAVALAAGFSLAAETPRIDLDGNLPVLSAGFSGGGPVSDALGTRHPLNGMTLTSEPPVQAASSGPPVPVTPSASFADLDILAPASSLSAFVRPNVDTGDLTDFFSSLDAEAGFWDTLGASSSANGSTGAPSIADAGLSPDVYSSGLTPRPVEPAFTLPVTAPLMSPSLAAAPVPSVGPPNLDGPPRSRTSSVVEVPPPRPLPARRPSQVMTSVPATIDEDGPVKVDLLYNTFNQGFFRSLPKPVREVVVQRAYNAATSSELSRNASMAMVMLYRLRMQQQQQQQDPEFNPTDLASTAEQQARLLAQSNLYFQRAIEHLQAPIPLEAKMVAVLDMQTYQYDQYGAAAANAILLLGEYFITEALGSQPLLDLSAIRDSANVLLSVVAWSDVIRCICIPRRRTLFAFSNLPGEPTSDSSTSAVVDDVSSQPYDVNAHQGLPVGLMLCVAATVNLACEMDALPDEVVKVKARGIENAVREWKPPAPDAQDLADSAGYVEKVSTSEMWRHAVIVFLYQAVHRHGPLSKPIRDAVQQILQIGVRMLNHHVHRTATSTIPNAPRSPDPNGRSTSPGVEHSVAYDEYLSAPATRAVPWFLAGTCAILPGDRSLCRRGLEACGKQQGYRDNLAALERLWRIVDEKGWVFDWRERLQEEKLFVGFL